MPDGNGKATIIRGGTLIDGSGRPPVENDVIVLEGARIRSVGALPPDVNAEDLESVHTIDASGKWIMPGLIDGHCHLSFGQPAMPGLNIARETVSSEFSSAPSAPPGTLKQCSGQA